MQLLTLISVLAALGAGATYFGAAAWNLYRADHAAPVGKTFGKGARRG